MPSIQSILKEYWGFSSFRPLQEDIINTVLEGNDCLALLPTGGGKSICFQVPAMAKEGLCLVITPLIALMKDQVENLRRKGITAFSIYSGMNRKEVVSTLQVAGNSNCKFLYVSPERLQTWIFKEYLPSLGITLIAVDEAHCISQWGYDFRPSYMRIASLREELPGVPVLALTASATPEVQKDICAKLLFAKELVFRQSFERPNLSYSVFNVSSKINKLQDVLANVPGTGIIYCRSRKKAQEISDLLRMKGLSADFYHAGLSQDHRNEKQDAWLKGKTRFIVCTNAFGMGIDKPDVRVVVHIDVTDCLENYYQEAGRAGRDGKRSYAVLLWSKKELNVLDETVDKKFPGIDEIRKVYKALMNHLQIPEGMGEGNYYELDASSFIKDFKLDPGTALSVLKTLEQDELLYFNDQVFVQPKLQVIAGRERLIEFEAQQPSFERLIKTVLRTYEGVIDQPVNINEKIIASMLGISHEEVTNKLIELNKYRIVEYIPKKERPQVYLFQNRVKAADLKIDLTRHTKRKKQFEERVMAMKNYIMAETSCRSVIIGNYFGDNQLEPCGICDNCISKKKKNAATAEFDNINSTVIEEIKRSLPTVNELTKQLKTIPAGKVKQIVDFLLAEEKILVTESGNLMLKNAPFSASST
jgi:ATP-dependent DNA helicase RecQ